MHRGPVTCPGVPPFSQLHGSPASSATIDQPLLHQLGCGRHASGFHTLRGPHPRLPTTNGSAGGRSDPGRVPWLGCERAAAAAFRARGARRICRVKEGGPGPCPPRPTRSAATQGDNRALSAPPSPLCPGGRCVAVRAAGSQAARGARLRNTWSAAVGAKCVYRRRPRDLGRMQMAMTTGPERRRRRRWRSGQGDAANESATQLW